ncbi:ABC transporter permease [Brevibacillus invocatus]|uniref:ABC transporter permease n=1 Tax=Brevibacillus invocatus TaxID=173959 RepID=A0A3M8CLR3_9BACL|nr:ABC transporter permease [Brevibacillus invocatus]
MIYVKSTRSYLIHFLTFIFMYCIIVGEFQIFVQAANEHNIRLASVGTHKELVPKNGYTKLTIQRIPGYLGAHISEIEVDGEKDHSTVLGFSDYDGKTDRGWYYVDINEASYWVNRFGGNPAYILGGGEANVFSSWVDAIDEPGFNGYNAYNLAELAAASGGAGYEIGDNLVPRGNGYISFGHFRTTQRPTGEVRIKDNQTKFKIHDTVTILPKAHDFSYYDRGIIVTHMSVINKTTGRGYQLFESNKEIRDNSGYLETPSATSNPKAFEWSHTYTYKPTEEGLYEVTFTITDRHLRSRQGSPSISQSTPYTVQFTVGEDIPPPDPENPDPDPPPSCSINQSTTKMDFQIVGNDVKDYTSITSGGSPILVEKNADITLFAAKNGTFIMNGADMEIGSGNNRKSGKGYFGSSGTYKVVYKSDDDKDCWENTFQVKSDKPREESCPIITINGSKARDGDTLEVLPQQIVYFRAEYTDSDGETQTADVLWDVTRPDGKIVSLPAYYEEVNGRDRLVSRPYWKLELPFGDGRESHHVLLEKGKTYKIKLNYKGTNWLDRPECNWQVTLHVKDTACSIEEQRRIKFKIYGSPPHPFSPNGDDISGNGISDPIYISAFSQTPEGNYQTNLSFSGNTVGTWYLQHGTGQIPLTGQLAAHQSFQLTLPRDFDVGDLVNLVFVSDIGCISEVTFEIMSDAKCYTAAMGMIRYGGVDYLWKREVGRGETVQLNHSDFNERYRPELITREKTEFLMYWLDPDTQQWSRKRNSKWLSESNEYDHSHFFSFPKNAETDQFLEGLYKIDFWTDNGWIDNRPNLTCDGSFFVQVGEPPDVENLLVIKNSFTITPKDPQMPGTEATITFQVRNAGKTVHDTKLAVRWESSDKETTLDVDQFKAGEVRTITIPSQYPQQSEDFIAHINPSRNKPENESIWTDNRATWPVKVIRVIEPPEPPGGGGDFDGGEIGLEIYDSDGRQLEKLGLHVDGVWEREPAKIQVVLDQSKINEGFQRTQQEINDKINVYKIQLEQFANGEGMKNVVVTAQPEWIADAKGMAVYNPAMLDLKVTGPGIPQQWQVSSASGGGDYLYTGTHVPTQTTWRQTLQSTKYQAEINGFQIVMDYEIVFDVSYESCSTDEEENEACEPGNLTRSMTGRYTITVKGSNRFFEVFEPNATGSIHHTAEWLEYHARDRYPNSQPNDFYAGERILTQVELQERHRHPVSGKYPVIESARAWISETGKRQTLLQSQLSLLSISASQWRGPQYLATKLGNREVGVDTPLMGDKQRGFQKDSSYAVYYSVQYRFGVEKGYPYSSKQHLTGHDQGDYRVPFRIIANAWERQGIRNHTTQ